MPYKDKVKRKAYNSTLEAKAKRNVYYSTPEAKAKKAAYQDARRSTPEGKAKRAAYSITYNSRPEVKIKTTVRIRNIRRSKNGWTPEMFEQTLIEQGNVCAVCREPFTEEDIACADHR